MDSKKKEVIMKKINLLGLMAGVAIMLVSCKTSSHVYHTFETECLGVELDGSQTLKAYGIGRYWLDAAEQARKNAVHDVLFKGNFTGSKECFSQPLILEVNAQEKYADYFNVFFRDGGEYAKFVTPEDERISKRVVRLAESRSRDQSRYSVVVRVKRVELKEKLIQDGILKQ
jgi:hypothetical protein